MLAESAGLVGPAVVLTVWSDHAAAATLPDDETPLRQLAQSLAHHAAGHAVGGLQLVFGGQWGARGQRLAVDLLPDRVPDLHVERAVAAFESHHSSSVLDLCSAAYRQIPVTSVLDM